MNAANSGLALCASSMTTRSLLKPNFIRGTTFCFLYVGSRIVANLHTCVHMSISAVCACTRRLACLSAGATIRDFEFVWLGCELFGDCENSREKAGMQLLLSGLYRLSTFELFFSPFSCICASLQRE